MATLSGMVVDNKAPVYSFNWLCEKMRDRGRVCLVVPGHKGYDLVRGVINGVRVEDGSGNNWLVSIRTNDDLREVFVRAGE